MHRPLSDSTGARRRDHRHAWLALVLLTFLLSACGAAPFTHSGTHSVATLAPTSGTMPNPIVASVPAPGGMAAPPTAAPPAREAATVVAVVDDDTIAVRFLDGHTDTVRYIGIDTPETKDPRTTVECFGEAAGAKNGASPRCRSRARPDAGAGSLHADRAHADRPRADRGWGVRAAASGRHARLILPGLHRPCTDAIPRRHRAALPSA